MMYPYYFSCMRLSLPSPYKILNTRYKILLNSRFANSVIHPLVQLIVVSDENICEQSCDEELYPHEDAENTDEWPEAIADRGMENDFLHEHPQENPRPDDGKRHTCPSEKVERTIGIITPKPDRDHIDESLHGALPVVLGYAMETRIM